MAGGSATYDILIVPAASEETRQKARLVIAEHAKDQDDLHYLLQVMGL